MELIKAGCFEHGNERSDSINTRDFLVAFRLSTFQKGFYSMELVMRSRMMEVILRVNQSIFL
jgi:hypothetical protein